MILDDSNHRSLEFASCWNGNGNGLLFHMTQPISRSTIKAIANGWGEPFVEGAQWMVGVNPFVEGAQWIVDSLDVCGSNTPLDWEADTLLQSYICPQSGLLGKNSDIWWSKMVVTSWCFVKSSVKTKFVFLSLPLASFFLPQRLGLHMNLAPPRKC